jgi:hypothetical protein
VVPVLLEGYLSFVPIALKHGHVAYFVPRCIGEDDVWEPWVVGQELLCALLAAVKTGEVSEMQRLDWDLCSVFPDSCHHQRKNSEMRQRKELGFTTEQKFTRERVWTLPESHITRILDSSSYGHTYGREDYNELRGRNSSRFSQNRVCSPFCPYMRFLDVSWCQIPDGNSQFCKTNDMEMLL